MAMDCEGGCGMVRDREGWLGIAKDCEGLGVIVRE